MAASEIDDRKPPKTETQRPSYVVALIIRTSMNDGFRHCFDRPPLNRRRIPEVVLSADAAHSRASRLSPSLRCAFLERAALIRLYSCLLYTSDAADERSSVDLG